MLPYCILTVFVKKENGKYKLYNALTLNGAKWQTKKINDVTFHFPSYHQFNNQKAEELINSIKKLREQWNLKSISINNYFADTFEEIDHLRGIDYQMGMGNRDKPTGLSDRDNNIIYCGGQGENYFHEAVHIYLNGLFPDSPYLEGLAVYYGGSMGHDLKWHLNRLNQYLVKHPEINLNKFKEFYYMDNYTNPISTIYGLICELAFKTGGKEKLQQLLEFKDFDTSIKKMFKINNKGLNKFLREQINIESIE